MKRVLTLVLLLAAATAAVYALRPAARGPRAVAKPETRGPSAVIDDDSREQLEKVLRQAAREEARPDPKRTANSR